ncbi:YycH family regulatory protein [Oceanobacillus chungangensis]|uniref:Regulatory protein YycH domain-containing protein n=1 Tax=Oceanobacillus chungangensis TaxID=1229152 RepID=A0A3D8PNN5_9BACI|nr:two-component system activity regulator YycH [Oceanobacillus chungangensis]RDW16765.1 hypothetical protein CWR45_14175 [Oceanobacillus chungangensis]
MKMETAKSLILIVLIGISLLLTFGLWSYQPELPEKSDKPPLNEAVNLGGKDNEKKGTVIEPREVIFHMDDLHYGFSKPIKKQEFYEQIQTWSISNLQTRLVSGRTPNKNEVEVIFPSNLPMEILNNLMSLSDSNTELPNWSFDRMYLSFNPDSKSLNLEILSIDGRNEATAIINDSNHYEFLWDYFQSVDEGLLQEYLSLEQTKEPIYIPRDSVSVTKQSYTSESIDEPNLLIKVFFPDPSLVSQTYSSAGDTYYTDSQRGMRVYWKRGRMEFVDPYSEDAVGDDQTAANMLTNSIKNINSHNGWTNEYNLMDINAKENVVRYQMYDDNGYPIYNALNLSYIDQKWINLQLNEYDRPLFELNVPLGGSTEKLMSGQDLISYLNRNYNLENFQDIRIGYRLIYHYDEDESSMSGSNYKDRIIELIPAWFKKENGEWNEIDLNEDQLLKGGD